MSSATVNFVRTGGAARNAARAGSRRALWLSVAAALPVVALVGALALAGLALLLFRPGAADRRAGRD